MYSRTDPIPSTSKQAEKSLIAVNKGKDTYVTVASSVDSTEVRLDNEDIHGSSSSVDKYSRYSPLLPRSFQVKTSDPKYSGQVPSRRPSVSVSNTSLQTSSKGNSSSSSTSLSIFRRELSSSSLNPGLSRSHSSNSFRRGIVSHLPSPTTPTSNQSNLNSNNVHFVSQPGSSFIHRKSTRTPTRSPTLSSKDTLASEYSSVNTGVLIEEDEEDDGNEDTVEVKSLIPSTDAVEDHKSPQDLVFRDRVGSGGSLKESISRRQLEYKANVPARNRHSLNGIESKIKTNDVEKGNLISKYELIQEADSTCDPRILQDKISSGRRRDLKNAQTNKIIPDDSADQDISDSCSEITPRQVTRRRKFKSNIEAFRSFIEEDDDDVSNGSNVEDSVGAKYEFRNETETTWETVPSVDIETIDEVVVPECASGGEYSGTSSSGGRRVVRITVPPPLVRKRQYPSLTMAPPIPTRGSMRRRRAVTISDHKTCAMVQSNMKLGLGDIM